MYKVVRLLGAMLVCFFVMHANTVVASAMTTEAWERREILLSPQDNNESIAAQKVLGEWRGSGYASLLRFVVVEAGSGANKLYVQWLSDDTKEVSYSISVREFNVSPEYAFGLPTCINPSCTRATLVATHAYEGHVQTFQLNLVGLGRYSVGLPYPRASQALVKAF